MLSAACHLVMIREENTSSIRGERVPSLNGTLSPYFRYQESGHIISCHLAPHCDASLHAVVSDQSHLAAVDTFRTGNERRAIRNRLLYARHAP